MLFTYFKLSPLLLVTFMLGIVAGQKITSHAYDMTVMEENVLKLIEFTYVSGCTNVMRPHHWPNRRDSTLEECRSDSKKWTSEMAEIFRNKIWEHKK